MKKSLLLLFSLLGLAFWVSSAMAQTMAPPSSPSIQEVSLTTVRAKIRAKHTFYLFLGREDNHQTQLALSQLRPSSQEANAPIVYLNLKGINSRSYKTFSKRYNIRSHSYLTKFNQGQQVAVYHNNWLAENTDLGEFLSSPLP